MTFESLSQDGNFEVEITQWASEFLLSQGYKLTSLLTENIKITPWSKVLRFTTSEGYIYLKHTPKLLGLEAGIIQTLRDHFHAPVPEIIAANAELDCFLMRDAGRPLRELLKEKLNLDLFCQAINEFTSMQLAVADHINIFLEQGVPDWRVDKLPDEFRKLLSQKEVLIAEGLSESEIADLETLLPNIKNLCNKLSEYTIKQTLVQPDFHDNNVLINETTQAITLIDLGEIAISHPFFSLINCLQQARKHHALTDNEYQKLVDASLKNYEIFGSREYLLEVFEAARTLWIVYDILCQYRLMLACGIERLGEFQKGKLRVSLNELIQHIS